MNRAQTQSGFTIVELMVSLFLASVMALLAIQLMVNNEQQLQRVQARSATLHSALSISALLRQAVWNAGHSTLETQVDSAIAISGTAPNSRLSVTYALDDGTFVERNCAGNRQSNGQTLRQTTDAWYSRASDASLYCSPSSGAGAQLEANSNGMAFSLIQSNQRRMATQGVQFHHQTTADSTLLTAAVRVQLSVQTMELGQVAAIDHFAFSWQPFIGPADNSVALQFVLPLAIDLQ